MLHGSRRGTADTKPYTMKVIRTVLNGDDEETNLCRPCLVATQPSLLWWQAGAAIIEGRSSHTLRNNSRGTGRHSEGARSVYHTAIRHAFSPWRPCGSSTADVHDCPRGVASLRHPLALKDTLGAHTGEAMTPSSHHATRCVAHPAIRFSPPGHGFPTLDARWKPWI